MFQIIFLVKLQTKQYVDLREGKMKCTHFTTVASLQYIAMWNISRLSTKSINPIGTLTNESLNFMSTLKFDRAITPSAVRPRYSTDSPLSSGNGTWRDWSSVTSSFFGKSSDLCIHSKLDGSSWQACKEKKKNEWLSGK